MGRVHEIAIAADAKAFDQGIRSGVIKPLEEAEDALDGLGRSRGPEQLERDLKDAQKETEQLADETKDTARQIERSYKDAGRDIKKGIGDGLDEAKGEAKQSGREAAASFSGEWDDVGDFIQETAANAFGGFGALGAAAGIAAAAGIGAVTSELTRQQEEAEKLKERMSEAYSAAAEEGRAYIDTAQIIAEANDLMFNPDRAGEYKQLLEDSKRLGLDIYDVIAANAGNQDAQREVQERINALMDLELTKHRDSDSIVGQVGQNVAGLKNRWDEVIAATEEQQRKAAQLQDITETANEKEREQIQRTIDASVSRWEAEAEARARAGQPIIVPVIPDYSALNRGPAPVIRLRGEVREVYTQGGRRLE